MANFSKSQIFMGCSICFAAGILAASRLEIYPLYVYAALALAAIIFGMTFLFKESPAPIAALFLFAAALGALRLQATLVPSEFAGLLNTKTVLEGYIVEDADVRSDRQLLTVLPKGFNQRILVTAPKTVEYFYGDWIVLEGKVVEPENFDDFDYQKYLERHEIYALMKYPKILMLKSHRLSRVKESLLRVKQGFSERVGRLLPEPQASLLLGILIGAKRGLPQTVTDDFNTTGMSHIVAISGFNITIILYGLSFFVLVLGRRTGLIINLIIIAAFVVLTGASASVVRAAVMGVLLSVALNIGRQYSIIPSLVFAGTIMLVINPRILFWDIGFQLSFLATLGIVEIVPTLDKLTERWPNPWQLKNILFATLAATLATLPIILLQFGRLSVVAPLTNILILPFLPLTMLLGFLTVLPFVGPGLAYATNLLLSYVLAVVRWFADVPGSSLAVEIGQHIFIALCMALLAMYLVFKKKIQKRVMGATAAIDDRNRVW